MENIKYKLCFSNGVIVLRGQSGGLALLWFNDMNLEIKGFSNTISMQLSLTCMTVSPEDSRKLLSYLNNQFSLPWFCCRDFNEILFVNEKVGGSQRSQHQMEGFR